MIILTAGLFAGGASAQGLSTDGVWEYHKITDEFTEEVSHYLILTAEKAPESSGMVNMLISCEDNTTSIGITTVGYVLNKSLDLGDTRDIDYRIDDLKAKQFKALVAPTGFGPHARSKNIPLIKDMFGGDKLRLRFPTYIGSETVTFKITNIETEIKPIREACNW